MGGAPRVKVVRAVFIMRAYITKSPSGSMP